MASIILTAAGNAVLPGVGGAIGGAIGGYIDSQYLYPALFGTDDQQPPALDQFKVSAADEGAPQNLPMGNNARVTGTIVWIGESKQVPIIESFGSWPFDSDTVVGYDRIIDVAINWGRRPDGINDILRIQSDARILWDGSPSVDIDGSTEISFEDFIQDDHVFTKVDIFGNETIITTPLRWWITMRSSASGPSFEKLKVDNTCVIAGSSVTGNNSTWNVMDVTPDVAGGWTARLMRTYDFLSAPANEAAGSAIDVDQINPNNPDNLVQQVTNYTGLQVSPNDAISLHEVGATGGDIPAFTEQVYTVIQGLSLQVFGGRLPRNFEAFLECDDDPFSAADAIDLILNTSKAGITSNPLAWDTTGVTGDVVGYNIRGPFPAKSALQPILLFHDILVQQRSGTVYFFDRGSAETVIVPEEDLAAHILGDEPDGRPFAVSDSAGVDLPKEVVVKYPDVDLKQQIAAQSERRRVTPTAGTDPLEIPIAMTASEAREVAARTLYRAWTGRKSLKLTLPPQYLDIAEGDLVETTGYGETWTILVERVDRYPVGLIEVNGRVDLAANNSHPSPSEASQGGGGPDTFSNTSPAIVIAMDIPPLQDSDGEDEGLYFAATLQSATATWNSGELQRSADEGTTYTTVSILPTQSVVGLTTAALGGGVSAHLWDNRNTLNIRLDQGALTSSTDDNVLAGANRLFVGGEIIAFVTATLESDGTYTISRLLRGLRNTESLIGSHSAGETVVFLNSTGTKFVSMGGGLYGLDFQYRCINFGSDAGSALPTASFEHQLHSRRPFEPWDVTAITNADDQDPPASSTDADDWIIRWKYRSRSISYLFSEIKPALFSNEGASASYKIVILDGSDAEINTYTVSGQEFFVYTDALQTADGLTAPTATLRFRVTQTSTDVGESKSTKYTFTA